MPLDMEGIEKKTPKLINCLGTLNTKTEKCSECKYAYICLLMQRELKGEVFMRYKDRGKVIDPKMSRLR